MKYNMINIKNIFKVSLLSFVVWQSSLFDVFAADANDPNLVVPVVCADGNSNQKYEQCANSCNNVSGSQVSRQSCSMHSGGENSNSGSCSGSDIYQYMTTNSIGVSFSQTCVGNGKCNPIFNWNGSKDNDKEVRNAVINKCKASCEFFKNQCSSYVVRIMDLMSAMPEIGISRVDPNLIEY